MPVFHHVGDPRCATASGTWSWFPPDVYTGVLMDQGATAAEQLVDDVRDGRTDRLPRGVECVLTRSDPPRIRAILYNDPYPPSREAEEAATAYLRDRAGAHASRRTGQAVRPQAPAPR